MWGWRGRRGGLLLFARGPWDEAARRPSLAIWPAAGAPSVRRPRRRCCAPPAGRGGALPSRWARLFFLFPSRTIIHHEPPRRRSHIMLLSRGDVHGLSGDLCKVMHSHGIVSWEMRVLRGLVVPYQLPRPSFWPPHTRTVLCGPQGPSPTRGQSSVSEMLRRALGEPSCSCCSPGDASCST